MQEFPTAFDFFDEKRVSQELTGKVSSNRTQAAIQGRQESHIREANGAHRS
jgi:hypothetical protein